MNNLKRIALKTSQSKVIIAVLSMHQRQGPDCPLLYISELTESGLIM